MRVLIIGAGGHAQVVADILFAMQAQGQEINPIGYLDDAPHFVGRSFLGLPVLGRTSDLPAIQHDAVIVGIGDNRKRSWIFEALRSSGETLVTACHPHAIVGRGVSIEVGSMICAGVIVNPGSHIGANVILNTACSVDHHNLIGAHAHVAPGAHLAGTVSVGEGSLIGAGATVLPGVNVGSWSVIGGGACAIEDVPSGQTVVGVPARPVTTRAGYPVPSASR